MVARDESSTKITHDLCTITNELRMICAMNFCQRYVGFTGAKHPLHMRHMSDNRQWKVVDERDSGNIFCGNIFVDDH
jgi:hypothetical protein